MDPLYGSMAVSLQELIKELEFEGKEVSTSDCSVAHIAPLCCTGLGTLLGEPLIFVSDFWTGGGPSFGRTAWNVNFA